MILNILAPVVLAASVLSVEPVPGHNETDDPTMNIVEVAASSGSFNTLVQAIEAAGLVETLTGEGPFTVFAPTDEAFAQIPSSDLQALLADKEALTRVLTYHVVPGKVYAKDVVGLSSAESVNGKSLTIEVADGKVMINDATVVTTDIEATNGLIHVIDKVILPKM
jgi:uncharacterized surface protein with fasciclin (FAS1) repeats